MATEEINDTWRPSARLDALRARARMLAVIRKFFAQCDVLEVETPVLSHAGTTDPNIESFRTQYLQPGATQSHTLYLATSPEFHMKRLLAAGSGPIYQVSRVFRNEEEGRLHNPEFSLLEWYRPGFDIHDLMAEVARLVNAVIGDSLALGSVQSITYRDAFREILTIDPFMATVDELIGCARHNGIDVTGLAGDDRDGWLDVLMSHCIQSRLGQQALCFVYDYPASQASLARIRHEQPSVAERFELFIQGIELANGYHELQDAEQQLTRFKHDLGVRGERGQHPVELDLNLIEALRHGLPDCSGVAVGLDRLLALKMGTINLQPCLTFPIERA